MTREGRGRGPLVSLSPLSPALGETASWAQARVMGGFLPMGSREKDGGRSSPPVSLPTDVPPLPRSTLEKGGAEGAGLIRARPALNPLAEGVALGLVAPSATVRT